MYTHYFRLLGICNYLSIIRSNQLSTHFHIDPEMAENVL